MNTIKKIAIALAVLMVAAIATPAMAEYDAEDTKMNFYKECEKGDLDYTYGTPSYQCINTSETATYSIDISHITPKQMKELVEARLYVYWTWSLYDDQNTESHGDDVGIYPALNVTINGEPVSFDYAPGTNWIDHYTDAKTIAAVGKHSSELGYVSWNFPSGTNCSTLDNTQLSDINTVTVTNVHPYAGGYFNGAKVCIQGVGLLLTLKEDNKRYWIAEGNDMTYVYWSTKSKKWSYGRTPEDAITKVTFKGKVPKSMNKATLTSVIPAGDSANNRLYFNNFFNYWDGQWNANPYGDLSISVTDVSANYLLRYDNVAGFQNGLISVPGGDKQMNVAGAFLVVEKEKKA